MTNVHFLQTEAWRRFQISLGHETIHISADGWQYLAILETGRGNRRLYCPYGPVVSDEKNLAEAIASLKDRAKEYNCDFVRIEPTGIICDEELLSGLGLVRAKRDIQPAHTWCIDLESEEVDLIAQMSSTVRNIHRNIAKKAVIFTTSNDPKDIDKLLYLLHGVAQHNHISPHSDKYFMRQAETLLPSGDAVLYFAWFDGECIAASLVYDSDTTRYYAHSGASHKHRKLKAGTALVSNMIIDAKRKGLRVVDLYGMTTSSDPGHPWTGFTVFKKSFGGYQHDYSGTWELPIKRFKHRIYHTVQRIKHTE